MTPFRSIRPFFLGNGLMQRRPNQLKPKRGDKGSQRARKDISRALDSDADDPEGPFDLEGGIGRP